MSKTKTSASWIATVYPDVHEWTFPSTIPKDNNSKCVVKYLSGQLEKCPTTGKLHYHVYILLSSLQQYTWVQRVIFNSHPVHLEVPKNDTASRKYCEKDDTRVDGPWELGTKPDGRNTRAWVPAKTIPIPQESREKLYADIADWKIKYAHLEDTWQGVQLTPGHGAALIDRLLLAIRPKAAPVPQAAVDSGPHVVGFETI